MRLRPAAELDAAIDRYAELLRRYRSTLDLMSPVGMEQLERHLDDARAYAELIAELSPAPTRLLDVGSGAGLPGIVIAAALPELPAELVERRRRRATFLRSALAAVGPTAAEIRQADVRALPGAPVQVVTAQAVAPFPQVYAWTAHRHDDSVVLLARKGANWQDEIEALAAETGTVPAVLAAKELPERGTLVAVQVQGGARCRSSV